MLFARKKIHFSLMAAMASLICAVLLGSSVSAVDFTPAPIPPPQPSSYGLEATKPTPPPSVAPRITTPGNGANFTSVPITVTGLCKTGLLVQVYDNNVMVAAINCAGGSFSVKVSPFSGQNELMAIQYDDLLQASPISNKVTVSFNNSELTAFGQIITLTSIYGRKGADPGSNLTWPLQLSGGTGPYAISVDWGDGSKPELQSQAVAGPLNINHVYSRSGIFQVSVTVTDKNGVSAFLQLVGVGRGKPSAQAEEAAKQTVIIKILWIPAVIALLLLIPAYWLGRHSELVTLHRKLEEDFNRYEAEGKAEK
jgi:hypothetical protein